jgi:CTP synthase (UTP-ammonia lyase)
LGIHIKNHKMGKGCGTYQGEVSNELYRVIVKEGRPLGRHRHRWEANMKMNQEMGWGAGLDLSGSGLGHVVDALECSNESSGSLNAGNFVTT